LLDLLKGGRPEMVHADTIDSVVMAWPGFIAAAGCFESPMPMATPGMTAAMACSTGFAGGSAGALKLYLRD
jgi:hypothetical protein